MPGALGLGQATATAISNGFFIFLFLMPSGFAVVSDAYLGRYNTLLLGLVYVIMVNTLRAALVGSSRDFLIY